MMGLVSAQRIAKFFQVITGGLLPPSKATILSFKKEASGKLDGEIQSIRTNLLNATVMHIDESILRCSQRPDDTGEHMESAQKSSFLVCARTHSTKDTTYLTNNGHKDIAGIKADGILPKYLGGSDARS